MPENCGINGLAGVDKGNIDGILSTDKCEYEADIMHRESLKRPTSNARPHALAEKYI